MNKCKEFFGDAKAQAGTPWHWPIMRLQIKYLPRTNLQIQIRSPSRTLKVHYSSSNTLSKKLSKNIQKSSSNADAQVSKPWPMRLQMKHLPRALGQTLLSWSLLTHRYSALQTLYYSALQPSTTLLTHLISLSLHRRSNLYGAAQPPWKQWSVIDCSTVLARFTLQWVRGLLRLK